MYLTYAEYTNMGGTLDETTFENIEYEAECFVNWITFNRLRTETTYPEEVKRCMFDVISLIQSKRNALLGSGENSTGADASIERMENDGVAITYNTMSSSELYDRISNDVNRIVVRYLSGVKNSQNKFLTYRGIYEDE